MYRIHTTQNRFGEIWCGFFPINLVIIRVFRRETARGFYPWGNVVSPRERVAEGLCGWRHGNSFPMTQSAQSLRQMRSIPHCSKAVFYVFVFDSIHNSATLHNLSPQIFHWSVFRAKGELKNPPAWWCWRIFLSRERGSNPWPFRYEWNALPTELLRLLRCFVVASLMSVGAQAACD